MKTYPIAIRVIVAALGVALCHAAEEKPEKTEKSESNTTKSESKSSEATAVAKAEARSSITTMVNGRPVTIIEEPDENGKIRRKMITYSPSGKPRVKDITPAEKTPATKPDPFAKKAPAQK